MDVVNPIVLPGADPTGQTDSTAALQAHFAKGGTFELIGTFKTSSPLNINGFDLTITGNGQSRTKIINTVSDVFTGNVDRLHISGLSIEAGGGHIFNFTRASRCHFSDLRLVQTNTSKSVLRHDGTTGDYIGNIFERCFVQATLAHTVPVFDLKSTGNVNANTWRDSTCLHSGNYVFSIENISASNWAYDNRFQDIVFEVCSGGSIRAIGCNNVIIDNCHEYDAALYNRDLIYIGQGTGLSSRNVTIRNCGRRGGVVADGYYDINLDKCQTAIIEGGGAIPDNSYKIRNNPSYPRVLFLGDYQKGTVIP